MPASIIGRSYVRVAATSFEVAWILVGVFHPAHVDGSRIVHLTRTTLLVEALCGETIVFDGHPDLAVICEECDLLAREAGGDPETWVALEAVLQLRAAA